jgi:hypothetical protein
MSRDTITLTKSAPKSGAAGKYPQRDELPKILITVDLRSAEVVELADTPSAHIALAILYKLLIINLLPFASITSKNVPRNGQ